MPSVARVLFYVRIFSRELPLHGLGTLSRVLLPFPIHRMSFYQIVPALMVLLAGALGFVLNRMARPVQQTQEER